VGKSWVEQEEKKNYIYVKNSSFLAVKMHLKHAITPQTTRLCIRFLVNSSFFLERNSIKKHSWHSISFENQIQKCEIQKHYETILKKL
jgi:hypothetical protein